MEREGSLPSLRHKYYTKENTICQAVLFVRNLSPQVLFCADTVQRALRHTRFPTDLAWFIDRLSEEIVLNHEIYACSMCAMPTCTSQDSGMTCRNGVKAWLLKRAEQFFPAKAA